MFEIVSCQENTLVVYFSLKAFSYYIPEASFSPWEVGFWVSTTNFFVQKIARDNDTRAPVNGALKQRQSGIQIAPAHNRRHCLLQRRCSTATLTPAENRAPPSPSSRFLFLFLLSTNSFLFILFSSPLATLFSWQGSIYTGAFILISSRSLRILHSCATLLLKAAFLTEFTRSLADAFFPRPISFSSSVCVSVSSRSSHLGSLTGLIWISRRCAVYIVTSSRPVF